jgi:hypothetical protein
MIVQVSWLLASPKMAHGIGSKDADNAITVGRFCTSKDDIAALVGVGLFQILQDSFQFNQLIPGDVAAAVGRPLA